jgi:hypothetical protein
MHMLHRIGIIRVEMGEMVGIFLRIFFLKGLLREEQI